MNHASLTARYRPQTFAEVAGQDTVKAILSRAAAEDRVAPAYLFSGTRGVGKTTIARIFAKALNCERAPTGEPCNVCEACRKITQGLAVDVVEIDGASNRGIEDAKRLKEHIGYAPLEGRYKVFIIDEAHMLTREAFNALLKTLEEPPARVTFFLATTEPHKFPVTIISRCQHFVFKRLTQTELERHLAKILNKEHIPFEPEAVTLIARRASGSVRDSMSLLGQVLALGEHGLTARDTREVLGLAGQDIFFTLLDAILERDCLAVAKLVRDLLGQGADIGFFLRELTSLWRNLFILAQSGENGFSVVDIPEAETARLAQYAKALPLAHIHACWQMTIEGQRRVLTSIEPAQALELLLLNLAVLPRLVPVQNLGPTIAAANAPLTPASPSDRGGNLCMTAKEQSISTASDGQGKRDEAHARPLKRGCAPAKPAETKTPSDAAGEKNVPVQTRPRPDARDETQKRALAANSAEQQETPPYAGEQSVRHTELESSRSQVKTSIPDRTQHIDAPANASPDSAQKPGRSNAGKRAPALNGDDAWNAFTAFCKKQGPQEKAHILSIAKGVWSAENELFIETASALHFEQTQQPDFVEWVRAKARDFRNLDVSVRIAPPPVRKSISEQREELLGSPAVKLISAHLSATLLDFWDKEPKGE